MRLEQAPEGYLSAKRYADATERNREPIATVWREVMWRESTPARPLNVLELASGTGQHAAWFAEQFPQLTWQPTDVSDAALESIEAWRQERGVQNVRSAMHLDVRDAEWPVEATDLIVAINLIHIAPWEVCQALFRGAHQYLRPDGWVFLYGPYNIGGQFTAPSNEQFDAYLRAQDSRWGIRDIEAVKAVARESGFRCVQFVPMPANNFSVVFRRAEGDEER